MTLYVNCGTLHFRSYHLNDCSEIISGIDEGQVFGDICEMCDQLVMAGTIVVVAALIGNLRREGFKTILNLLPKVYSLRMLTTFCGMGSEEKSCFTRHRTLWMELEESNI